MSAFGDGFGVWRIFILDMFCASRALENFGLDKESLSATREIRCVTMPVSRRVGLVVLIAVAPFGAGLGPQERNKRHLVFKKMTDLTSIGRASFR